MKFCHVIVGGDWIFLKDILGIEYCEYCEFDVCVYNLWWSDEVCWKRNFILRRIKDSFKLLILICELWICYMLLCNVYNLGGSN